MIIGISGRRLSGKTFASNFLVAKGYKKFTFATFLKESVSKILDVPLEVFYAENTKDTPFDTPYLWDRQSHEQLCDMAGDEIEFQGPRKLFSLRNAMEFVGTDILRRHDVDFHIKKTVASLLAHNGNAVIDDMRFPNELLCLKKIGAKSVYLMRPSNMDFSNNIVESSLKYDISSFDHILINSREKEFLAESIDTIVAGHAPKCLGAEIVPKNMAFSDHTSVPAAFWAGYIYGTESLHDGVLALNGDWQVLDDFGSFISDQEQPLFFSAGGIFANPFLVENLKYWKRDDSGLPYQLDKIINARLRRELCRMYRTGFVVGQQASKLF